MTAEERLSSKVTSSITLDEHERVFGACQFLKVSVSQFVREAIMRYLNRIDEVRTPTAAGAANPSPDSES